jgi:endo-1,4-beta-xylanase
MSKTAPHSNVSLERRQLIAGAASMAAASMVPVGEADAQDKPGSQIGARIPFGAAIHPDNMKTDPAYKAAFVRHCQVLVAEGGMKWPDLRPTRDQYSFTMSDIVVNFAKDNGLAVRGHTLVWCEALPDWTKAITSAAEAERELRQHVERVVRHYKGRIRDWDVVNEPIAETQTTGNDFRPGLWSRYLGDNYVAMALRAAADADPTADLVVNEYGIEGNSSGDKKKRAAFLRLIRNLKDKGVPLTGVGIQGHLDPSTPVDLDGMATFAAEMKSLGLKVLITELDVNDQNLPSDIQARDLTTAKITKDFLTAINAGARPALVCTWGITDRHTWIPMYFKRKDGLANRPLPLDAQFEPKPMMRAIQQFCRGQA